MSKLLKKRLLLHTAQIQEKKAEFWWYAIAVFVIKKRFDTASKHEVSISYSSSRIGNLGEQKGIRKTFGQIGGFFLS